MRNVPVEYQNEKQKEFRLLEVNEDDFDENEDQLLSEQIDSLNIQHDSLLNHEYSIQKSYTTKQVG